MSIEVAMSKTQDYIYEFSAFQIPHKGRSSVFRSNGRWVIELAVFMDAAAYKYHRTIYKTEANIRDMLLSYINQVGQEICYSEGVGGV